MKAGKVVLLLGVLAVGASLEIAVAVRDRLPLGALGWRILGGRAYGPSFSVEEQREVELPAGAGLRVENAFGAVQVRGGDGKVIKVRLRKVVYAEDEARARAFAARVLLTDVHQGNLLRISTNRSALDPGEVERHGLETHLELELPAGVRLEVQNEHGSIDASDVASARLVTSFESLHVSRVHGDVQVEARHGDVEARAIEGALELSLRHGDAQVQQVRGRAKIDLEHGDLSVEDTGELELEYKRGDATVRGLHGRLLLRGEHASLDASDVEGVVDVETAFRGVKLRNVHGDVRVVNHHGSVDAQDVTGAVHAEAAYDDVKLARISGAVDVAVEHGDLDAEGLAAGAKVSAVGDNVTLDGFKGPVEVQARRGDVSLTPDGPLLAALSVRTENGGIVLVVPNGSRGELDAETQHGDIEVQDLPGVTADAESAGNHGHARGRLGDGGGALTLRTRRGDIRIEGRTPAESSKP